MSNTSTYNTKRTFDSRTCRHTINGFTQVLHCHHYATLYTQLAMDCNMLDAKKLLSDVSEDTFYQTLNDYFTANNVTELSERIQVAEDYYSTCGLGKMQFTYTGPYSGAVELTNSHVDEGWIKKWGQTDKPVNYITSGYVAAAFSAVYNKPTRSYNVTETQSIVTGSPTSVFNVVGS